jgi:CHAT domain-containing protein
MSSVDVLAAKLSLLHRSGATEDAIAVADRVFALVQNQRTELDAVRLGPYWSGRTNSIYASHADYLLTVGEAEPRYRALAFGVAERANAVSLRLRRLETLLDQNATNVTARDEWLKLVAEVQRAPGVEHTEEQQLEFERRLTDARERYFAAQGPEVTLPTLEIQPIDAIPPLLGEDTVLVKFVSGPTRLWRFDLWSGGWSVAAVGDADHMRELIDGATYELSNPYVRGETKTVELANRLFGSVPVELEGKRLLISPSDGLTAFPFAALRVNDEYLADLVAISNVPSFSEYFVGATRLVERETPGRLDIAVLADPAFSEAMAANDPVRGTEAFRGWSESLQRLPASAREASDLSRYYAESGRLILTGTQATQSNFFDSRVTSAKVIHIATHGYFNESLPELIGFAMAKDDPSDDGFVSMAEISAQKFSADLVVISACNTGRGLEIAGEGNMSLARTFLAQGVDAVVSTLWPVSDEATALFMKEFYRALNEGKLSLADSLASAQRVLRATTRFRDPFFWSGYALTVAAPEDLRLSDREATH